MIRCSEGAVTEPLIGTAPHRRYWWAIEHPGPWPAHPIDEAVLGDTASWAIAENRRDDTTVLLVRRPDAPASGNVWWADTERGELHRGRLSAASIPELQRVEDPLWLVCTHGRRDQCCAILGRPMLDVVPGAWESTHIGGHRFAPTILLLPAGLVLGRVAPEDWPGVGGLGAPAVLHMRGLTSLDSAAQVVDGRARVEWARGATDAVDVSLLEEGARMRRYRVTDSAHSAEATVTRRDDPAVVASCGAEPSAHTRWEITGWQR